MRAALAESEKEAAEMRAILAERERGRRPIAVAEERARIARRAARHRRARDERDGASGRSGAPPAPAEPRRGQMRSRASSRRAARHSPRCAASSERCAATVTDSELGLQPGLDALDSLVEDVSRAGLPVRVHVDGAPFPLPRAIDLPPTASSRRG